MTRATTISKVRMTAQRMRTEDEGQVDNGGQDGAASAVAATNTAAVETVAADRMAVVDRIVTAVVGKELSLQFGASGRSIAGWRANGRAQQAQAAVKNSQADTAHGEKSPPAWLRGSVM
jgi:hypothetical protein